MAAAAHLRGEERIGLVLAALLHAALVAVLILQPASRAPVPVPERMVVSLSDEVALTSTSPDPAAAAQAAVAPVLAENPAPAPEPEARPVEQARPEPARPEPVRPKVQPKPPPTAKAAAKPPSVRPRPAPDAISAVIGTQAKPAPKPAAKPAIRPGGGSRVGDDFLKGTSSGDRKASTALPASAVGPAERASLVQAISRQIKPHWTTPAGADAELLVTVLAFDLKPDGTLDGPPRVVSQDGVTDANRPQAGRHAEQAIRAVQLASPFELPTEYYNVWKHISAFRFDRKLSR